MYTYTEKNFSSKKYPYTSAMDNIIEEYIDHELTLIQHHLLLEESKISELKAQGCKYKITLSKYYHYWYGRIYHKYKNTLRIR